MLKDLDQTKVVKEHIEHVDSIAGSFITVKLEKSIILDPPFTGRSKIQFSLCNEERSNNLCFICLSQHGKYPTHT